MSLAEYRGKRRFSRTSEPRGGKRNSPGQIFVIQQHGARRLHFDLRLELAGTLKSWAVPKGLALDPTEKRLAVHVEDHPIEYAGFEGNIPAGEYGAGAVIVWDRGTWEPLSGDAEKDYRKGELKFRLNGEKLTGAWMLVRMRQQEGETADNWLVIKERDDSAVPISQFDVVAERPESVISGMTLAEVAAAGAGSAELAGSPRKKRTAATAAQRRGGSLIQKIRAIVDSKPGPLPASMEPALARTTPRPPAGNSWLHEIKFDGYRMLAWLDHGQVRLRTRNGHDWTARFPEIADELSRLPANLALLDGEVVALDASGASSFPALQQVLSSRRTSVLVYCLFDALNMEGFDLRSVPHEQRKALLGELLAKTDGKRLHFVEHIRGGGAEFFVHCRELGLEGIISKRAQSPYPSGRSDDWLKLKVVQAEPFVIGGYTSSRGGHELRSLLVGYHDERGQLIYAGRVGTGFDEATLAECERRLRVISRPTCPFLESPPKDGSRDLHWVRPQIVAQVRFAGWSSDGMLRQPAFAGFRDDSHAAEIGRDAMPVRGRPTAALEPKSDQLSPRKVSRPAKERQPSAGRAESKPDLAGVRLTNPGKILYPAAAITKLDLAKYYIEIADWVLPHLIDRPLTLVRCPDGVKGQSFYQKHAGPETPAFVRRELLPEADGEEEVLYVRDLKGLFSLVQ
ncbi:MAG TPA: DNA ligase D, partial [Planctomycetaceae bacterium]|nr:DNA ligase D [Planctomycetaceae bacterium]